MNDPLSVQYSAFNQRRLHYNVLFWLSLALEFTGVAFLYLLNADDELITLGALSCFLMAFIAFRLLRQESYYTQALRNIDASWIEAGLKGIQTDLPEGRFGSRKLVICALIGLGSYLLSDVYIF